MNNIMFKGIWTFAYVATIVLSNLLLVWLAPVQIFGIFLPPAILAFGLVFVLRDFAQREIGHYVLVAIGVAAALTYLLAGPQVAAASIAAFLMAELADYLVYTLTKRPLSQRVLISSMVSVPMDTFVFFWALGFLNVPSLALGIAVKMIATLMIWAWLRNRENATGPGMPIAQVPA